MLKKLTLTLFAATALFPALRAENVEVDGIHYSTSWNNTASVMSYEYSEYSSSGNADYYIGDITIPSSITVNGGTYTVTTIARYAFRESNNLTSVTLPNTITEIGVGAFEHCTSLAWITLPESVQAISGWAFMKCSQSFVLQLEGETPPSIAPPYGFNNIIVPDDAMEAYYASTFASVGCNIWSQNEFANLPDTDTSKNDYVITISAISTLNKELIKSNGMDFYPLVETLKVIGTINTADFTTIKSLTNLKSLDLSEATIEGNAIPAEGLKNLVKLESIILPESLTSIGNNAFSDCSALQKVGDLPALTSIGDFAFSRCSSLQSIGNMNALTNIGQYAFSDNSYNYKYCSALQTIGEMPKLSTIGTYAFYNCSALQKLGDLPALTSIGAWAFAGCGISEFNLPESIASVATNAFSEPALVHFAGATPPTFDGTLFSTLICVPAGSVGAYAEALPDMLTTKILTHGATDFDVTVSARENDSDVLIKVNEGFDKDMALNVLNLKVSGTINSYDIIVFRNKMLNLRKLDLSDATIVGSSYEYYSGCHTEDNVVGANMFRQLNLIEVILPKNAVEIGNCAFGGCVQLQSVILSDFIGPIGNSAFQECTSLKEINIPETLTSIGSSAFENCINLRSINFPKELSSQSATIGQSAFYGCSNLKTITLPIGITYIGGGSWGNYGAFSNCTSLTEVNLPPTLTDISANCFNSCRKLKTISMPPTIKSIGKSAFAGCEALTEFRIPAGVNSIGDGAIPNTVRDVYTYTIQPTSIGENTFGNDTYLQATLHVPDTSEKLYYWDTQWSQFQSIENFNEPYSYFYLDDKDLIEDPETPRIDGETDEETGEKTNPDADLGQGSGLIVDGDDSQDLGNVDIEADGKGNGTTIIGGDSNTSESGGNVNIDMLNVNIPITANRWYFFAFPFDVPCENIKFNGQMVWRYYDGEWRAMHGSGSWKDMKGEKLERGRGYIFQGSKSGTLTLSIPNVSFNGQDWTNILEQFISANPQDASWNFIGNPFLSYYELADLGFDGPITWWNPNTNSYEALSPEDDDLSMYPFMAFFVQKPADAESVDFFSNYQETNNQKNDPNHRASARKRRAARRSRSITDRKLINLSVTDGTNSDRTRVVFNSEASMAYEVGTDASKFISTEAPQIYSLDAENVRYAINERPAGEGIVNLGFYAPADGSFTIECTRTDCELTLKDCQTGRTVDLTPGSSYEFTAKQGYDDSRFVLNAKGNGITAIEAAETDATNATYYRVNGIETDGTHQGLMIEVKGNEATKVIRK